jgi:hypothetical protein
MLHARCRAGVALELEVDKDRRLAYSPIRGLSIGAAHYWRALSPTTAAAREHLDIVNKADTTYIS